MSSPRYAISYTPPPYSRLAKFGASVLGYDCFEARDVPQLAVQGIDPAILALLTVEPRRYGFHANFVPPFRLGNGSEDDLLVAAESLARRHHPVLIGALTLDCLDEFIALRVGQQPAHLEDFAAACRHAFDPFRTPDSVLDPDRHELSSYERQAMSNSSAKFRYQMTLVGPLPTHAPADLATHIARAFEKLERDEVEVGSISLMRQEEAAARFRVLACKRLTGR